MSSDVEPHENQTSPPLRLAPDHWDLYILVAGVALGLLVSPWVLGRISPVRHDRLFLGGVQEAAERQAYIDDTETIIRRMHATGEDEPAIRARFDERRERYMELDAALTQARERHARVLNIVTYAALALVILLMIAEALITTEATPRALAVRRWLGRARYVAMSAWIVLALGRSDFLSG